MIKLIKTLEEILEIFDFADNGAEDYEDLSLRDKLVIANSFSELAREVDYISKSEHLLCGEGYSIARIIGSSLLAPTNPLCTCFDINEIRCYLTFVDYEETVGMGNFTNPYRLVFGSDLQFEGLCTVDSFELLYTKARKAYAQQIYDILTKPQDLRISHHPQLGADIEPFEIHVDNLLEAYTIMNTLANYDLYQYYHRIKPDYCNCQILEIWDCTAFEWRDCEN